MLGLKWREYRAGLPRRPYPHSRTTPTVTAHQQGSRFRVQLILLYLKTTSSWFRKILATSSSSTPNIRNRTSARSSRRQTPLQDGRAQHPHDTSPQDRIYRFPGYVKPSCERYSEGVCDADSRSTNAEDPGPRPTHGHAVDRGQGQTRHFVERSSRPIASIVPNKGAPYSRGYSRRSW